MSSDAGDALVGTTLAGYHVELKLGTGATGVVFRARAGGAARPIALKVLHDNLGSISALKRRFDREARVLAKLEHPNIVQITDYGVSEAGQTYIAMELLEGRTLEQLLDEAPIAPMHAVTVMREVLKGLAYAHDAQVVHRDLKPANVFLCQPAPGSRDETVKLLDFGLAKILSDDEHAEDGTLTRRGRIVGTPAYMAPEQITGTGLDVRADVYACGILLYELLADRRPFLSERRSDLLRAHLLLPPPPLSEARAELEVAPELAAVVMRALEKAPEHRYENARAMLAALEAVPPGCAKLIRPGSAQTRSRAGASSEIITTGERREVSASASGSYSGQMPTLERQSVGTNGESRPRAPTETPPEVSAADFRAHELRAGRAPAGQSPVGKTEVGQAPAGPPEMKSLALRAASQERPDASRRTASSQTTLRTRAVDRESTQRIATSSAADPLVPTALLYVFAALLFITAALVWMFLGPR